MDYTSIRELTNEYSKNKNNIEYLEKLLLNVNDKTIINKLLPKMLNKIERAINIDGVKLLIKYGADVNYFGHDHECALMYCCMDPIISLEIIEFLIESGANVNNKSRSVKQH